MSTFKNEFNREYARNTWENSSGGGSYCWVFLIELNNILYSWGSLC